MNGNGDEEEFKGEYSRQRGSEGTWREKWDPVKRWLKIKKKNMRQANEWFKKQEERYTGIEKEGKR